MPQHLALFLTIIRLSYSPRLTAGPYCWSVLDSTCGGTAQSPVNLANAQVDKYLHGLELTSPTCTEAKLFNDGTTFEINVHSSCPSFGLHFGAYHYHLDRLELRAPSEHTVGGARFSGEMQMIHTNNYGGTLVLSVLLDAQDGLGARNNFLDLMWGTGTDSADGVANPVTSDLMRSGTYDTASSITFDRAFSPYDELLPADPSYFTYSGSLTAPPCTAGVTWVVMSQPVRVSVAQIDAFTTGLSNVTNATNTPGDYKKGALGTYINARPVQALNGRKISYFAASNVHAQDDSKEDDSFSSTPFYQPMLFLTASIFATFGVFVLLIGGFFALINFFILVVNRLVPKMPCLFCGRRRRFQSFLLEYTPMTESYPTLSLLRKQIAKSIVISLEVLVAADVIDTLAKPTPAMSFTELGFLAVIVAVRTVLALHLAHDLHAIKHIMAEHESLQTNRQMSETKEAAAAANSIFNDLMLSEREHKEGEVLEAVEMDALGGGGGTDDLATALHGGPQMEYRPVDTKDATDKAGTRTKRSIKMHGSALSRRSPDIEKGDAKDDEKKGAQTL